MRRIRTFCFALTYSALLALFAGLIAHRSYNPVWFGRYSTKYGLGLILLGIVLVCWKPIFDGLCSESVVPLRGALVRVRARHKWTILILLVLLGSGGAEWWMRRRHPWARLPDPYLVRQFHPFLQNETIPGDAKMHINETGFRGDPLPPRSECDVLVFMLGGSTVYSHDVPYEKGHFVLLQQLLRERHPGISIFVQNAGNEYHTTLHSLIKYVTRIRKYRPDVVIMWHGINDLCRSFTPNRFTMPDELYGDDYRHYLGPIAGLVRYYATPVPTPPLLNSMFLNWLAEAWFSDIRTAVHLRQEQALLQPELVTDFPSLRAFKNNLEALATLLQADGVTVVMASEPSMYGATNAVELQSKFWMQKSLCRMGDRYPTVSSLAQGMTLFNQASRQVAQAYGFLFVDLDALLPKEPRYMFDDCHYTVEGNRYIAELLFQFLEERNVIENLASRRASARHKAESVESFPYRAGDLAGDAEKAWGIP